MLYCIQGSDSYNTYCATVNAEYPKSCLDLLCLGNTATGVYAIYPIGTSQYTFDVYCDQETDGGGYTVSTFCRKQMQMKC